VAGLSGGLFARLIVVSVRGLPDRFSRWRSAYPLRFAAGCGLAVAVIGLATAGCHGRCRLPHHPRPAGRPGRAAGVYTLLKFCATWISAWSGVPAGVFAPSLAIGAGIGHDVALAQGVGRERPFR
jgi:H+/Cl- antiporter ClcA